MERMIPETLRDDLEKAVALLKEIGCSEVYLFGSLSRGQADEHSDLDLAVRGCPPDRFYYAVGKLLATLSRPVDLIDLDRDARFGAFLREHDELVRVA